MQNALLDEGNAVNVLQAKVESLEKDLDNLRSASASGPVATEANDLTDWTLFHVPDARDLFPQAANACSANGAKRQRQEYCFSSRSLKYIDEAAIPVLHRRTAELLYDIGDNEVIWIILDYAFGTITGKCLPANAPTSVTGLRRAATQLHPTTSAEKWLAAALLVLRELDGNSNLSVKGAFEFVTRRAASGIDTVFDQAKKYLAKHS